MHMKLTTISCLNAIQLTCLIYIGLSASSVHMVHASCLSIANYSPGAQAIDIEALFWTDNQTIFQVLNNGRIYHVSYFTGCEDDYNTLLLKGMPLLTIAYTNCCSRLTPPGLPIDMHTQQIVETQCTAQPNFNSIPGPQDNSPEFIGDAVRNLLEEAGISISVITDPSYLHSWRVS